MATKKKAAKKKKHKGDGCPFQNPASLSGEAPLERLFHLRRRRPIRTFGGCPAARLVLETRIREWGNGLHEPSQESVEESGPQRRSHYSGQALFPDRRSRRLVPSARLRTPLLGN